MRTFKLQINNGVAVLPNTIGTIAVIERLMARKGGFMHIVAYTNAKPLKKAKQENMDLVKITDCMCINGLPKTERETENANTETPTREKPYFRIDYSKIQYRNSGEIALMPHLSNNPKHRAKSYYVDRNNGRVYDKQYLIDNGYISSATYNNDSDIKWVQFKTENIIMIK